MMVSILVNNYNYAAFVGAAIESALAQNYDDCEVIVLDDGSTDASWKVIRSFGNAIHAVRQENAGQGAAYNHLWRLAHGDCVLFLDADDCLDPDAIPACMDALDEDVASVQFRLRLIDEDGARLPGAVPYLMHDGYVTPMLRRFVHYAGPPGSGNLYRAQAIARAFPLDAPFWRRGADTIPFVAAGYAGRIVSLRRELGSYRLHRSEVRSAGIMGNIDPTYRAAVDAGERRRRGSLAMLRRGFGISLPGPFLPPPSEMRTRALSWRLDREHHPYADTRRGLLQMQLASLRHWPGYGRIEQATLLLWMLCVVVLPRTWVRRLAASNTAGGIKAWVRQVFSRAPEDRPGGSASMKTSS